MPRFRRNLVAWLAGVLVGLVTASAYGQVPLALVPDYLPLSKDLPLFNDLLHSTDIPLSKNISLSKDKGSLGRQELVDRRKELAEERKRLNILIDEHNNKTAPKDTPESERLRLEGTQLREMMIRHVAASRKFNGDVAQAETNFRINPEHAEAWQKFQDEFRRRLGSRATDAPIDAPIINHENERNAYNYQKVIDQFNVTNSARYASADEPHCNIFARDVVWAMHVELPAGKTANEMFDWLNSKEGKRVGWHMVTGGTEQAQKIADKGCPTIAIMRGDKHGHVMVVRPGSPEDMEHGPAIAQAGTHNLKAAHLIREPNPIDVTKVQYWYHD